MCAHRIHSIPANPTGFPKYIWLWTRYYFLSGDHVDHIRCEPQMIAVGSFPIPPFPRGMQATTLLLHSQIPSAWEHQKELSWYYMIALGSGHLRGDEFMEMEPSWNGQDTGKSDPRRFSSLYHMNYWEVGSLQLLTGAQQSWHSESRLPASTAVKKINVCCLSHQVNGSLS